jgi:hypothetical protein
MTREIGMIPPVTLGGAMETTATQQEFIPYPTNRVVGTIADAAGAHAAIEALLQAGVDRPDIDILHGEASVDRLDPTGAEHGFLAQFQRTLIRIAGPAEEYHFAKERSRSRARHQREYAATRDRRGTKSSDGPEQIDHHRHRPAHPSNVAIASHP